MSHTTEGAACTDLILEVFRLNGALLSAGDRLSADVGLTSARWQVLGALKEKALPVPHIARDMGLTRQGVQKTVNVLKSEYLVEFQDNPHHKSSRLVALTPEGQKRLAEMEKIQTRWVNDLAADAGVEDLKVALSVLCQLRLHLKKAGEDDG